MMFWPAADVAGRDLRRGLSNAEVVAMTKHSVENAKSRPGAKAYLEAAQSIEIWWAGYEYAVTDVLNKKIPKPIYSKKLMLDYAIKSALLGNSDAANLLASYYGESSPRSDTSKEIEDCWDRVISGYVTNSLYQDSLTRKCVRLSENYNNRAGQQP